MLLYVLELKESKTSHRLMMRSSAATRKVLTLRVNVPGVVTVLRFEGVQTARDVYWNKMSSFLFEWIFCQLWYIVTTGFKEEGGRAYSHTHTESNV